MSYLALYRKYRPRSFDEVVEQDHIVTTLKNAITHDRLAHAYLFCGSRGTGKTSFAKIVARAINCQNPIEGNPCNTCTTCKGILAGTNMDVLEIDAASNNGVDHVREIREEVHYSPSESRKKVYIIDEVHMLSTGAFNALLKTLEEPPAHVLFILATTESHKIPPTILSRCQRFDFQRISVEGIAQQLRYIAKQQQVNLQPEGAQVIAKLSEGGLRDAIGMLDQCIDPSQGSISVADIFQKIGVVGQEFVQDMVDALQAEDIPGVFTLVEQLMVSGKDIKQFIYELTTYYRDLLIYKLTQTTTNLIYPYEMILDKFTQTAKSLSEEYVMTMVKECSMLEHTLRISQQPRMTLEIFLVKLAKKQYTEETDKLKERVSALEKVIREGSVQENVQKSVQGSFLENTKSTQPDREGVKKRASDSQEEKRNTKQTFSQSEQPSMHEHTAIHTLPFWKEIIMEVKKRGRMTLYANLLESKASMMNENIVLVYPENPFSQLTLSKVENREVLESILKQWLKKDVQVRVQGSAQKAESFSDHQESVLSKVEGVARRSDIPFQVMDEEPF